MKFHDFSPFYRSSEGIKPKVSGDRLLDNPLVADLQSGASFKFSPDGTGDVVSTIPPKPAANTVDPHPVIVTVFPLPAPFAIVTLPPEGV